MRTDFSTLRNRFRGSALIAILWIVALLSLAVFSATQFLFVELESDSNSDLIFRAEQLADRGIALAAHPDVEFGDPILSQTLSATESFFARISSEGERLNLNALLEDPEADRVVLEDLFSRWGLRTDEAIEVVDNLIDWVDEDDESTGQGAEIDFYFSRERPNHPFNEEFASLEEVELVNRFDLVISVRPDWKEFFTLISDGELDLNEAPTELIVVACECGEAAAESFVEVRNGFDRIKGTDDDVRFESVEDAIELLGIPAAFEERILNRVSIEDSSKRLVSIGRFGAIAVERIVTVQYTGETGEVQQWKTRRIE